MQPPPGPPPTTLPYCPLSSLAAVQLHHSIVGDASTNVILCGANSRTNERVTITFDTLNTHLSDKLSAMQAATSNIYLTALRVAMDGSLKATMFTRACILDDKPFARDDLTTYQASKASDASSHALAMAPTSARPPHPAQHSPAAPFETTYMLYCTPSDLLRDFYTQKYMHKVSHHSPPLTICSMVHCALIGLPGLAPPTTCHAHPPQPPHHTLPCLPPPARHPSAHCLAPPPPSQEPREPLLTDPAQLRYNPQKQVGALVCGLFKYQSNGSLRRVCCHVFPNGLTCNVQRCAT